MKRGDLVEKIEELLECYALSTVRIFRGKKMVMLADEKGQLYGISTVRASEHRTEREYYVKDYLIRQGFVRIDQLVRNEDGRFLTEDKYHTPYLLRHFFNGPELNVYEMQQVREGAANLAKLHLSAEGICMYLKEAEDEVKQRYEEEMAACEEEEEKEFLQKQRDAIYYYDATEEKHEKEGIGAKEWCEGMLLKRDRELKRIASYMKKMNKKSPFTEQYNHCSGLFLKESAEAMKQIAELFSEEERLPYGLLHGNYQHHNVLKTEQGWATIGMEQFRFGPSVVDLYDYVRKVLEKNQYCYEVVKETLKGYEAGRHLTKAEYKALFLLLSYPEKFWKISNRYYNTKKTWVPPKMVEKLHKVVEQNQRKRDFLVKFREDYV